MQPIDLKSLPFEVLHSDAALVVINKPAGLAVHPGPRTADSLEDWLPALAARLGQRRLPVIMHRLDRDTSGCLLLARTPAAVRRLAALFATRAIHKRYLAILDTLPATPAGTIDAPLHKVSSAASGWRMVIDARHGKPARTHWRIIDSDTRLVEFTPETGRTHQLRVHATLIGTAIAGDPIYGATPGPMRLHARFLKIPVEVGQAVEIEAPLPPDWPDCNFIQN